MLCLVILVINQAQVSGVFAKNRNKDLVELEYSIRYRYIENSESYSGGRGEITLENSVLLQGHEFESGGQG